MPDRYDAIIVGGGHNGLTCGAYLARAGRRTIVLERRPIIGGAAVTEEIIPGFRFSVFSYLMSLLHPKVIADFELRNHGFRHSYMRREEDGRRRGRESAGLGRTQRAIAHRRCAGAKALRAGRWDGKRGRLVSRSEMREP
jgi:phytoene dehydrogenase-like protein